MATVDALMDEFVKNHIPRHFFFSKKPFCSILSSGFLISSKHVFSQVGAFDGQGLASAHL